MVVGIAIQRPKMVVILLLSIPYPFGQLANDVAIIAENGMIDLMIMLCGVDWLFTILTRFCVWIGDIRSFLNLLLVEMKGDCIFLGSYECKIVYS